MCPKNDLTNVCPKGTQYFNNNFTINSKHKDKPLVVNKNNVSGRLK